MKTKHMLKSLIHGILCSFTWVNLHAQQVQSEPKHGLITATATCGTDTVSYPLIKASGSTTVAMIKGDIEGIAQWYELPDAASISGLSFKAAVKDAAHIGKTAIVTLRVYQAGPDSLPQGVALGFTTLQIDSTMRVWKAPLIVPVSPVDNYIVSLEYGNGITENDTILMALSAAGDGAGESLGAGLYNNLSGDIWLDFEHLIPSPDRDAMLFPWVSYTLTTGFDLPSDSVCVDESLLFSNTTTAFAKSRMYNRRIQAPQTYGDAFSWSFGDGTNSNAIDPVKTYTALGSNSVLLTAAITGYHTQCSEPIAAAIVVEARPIALYNASANAIVQHDSVFFTAMGSGGTCTWDFGDGSPTVNSCADQAHAFDSLGTFAVVLTVTSPYGCTETYTETIVVSDPLGIESVAPAALDLKAWPNPVSGGQSTLQLSWTRSSAPTVLTVCDLQGRVLATYTVSNANGYTIETANLAAGMLILHMQQAGRQSQIKVLVAK